MVVLMSTELKAMTVLIEFSLQRSGIRNGLYWLTFDSEARVGNA